MKIILIIINFIFYLLVVALWLIVPEYKIFNTTLTIFTVLMTLLLLFFSYREVLQWTKSLQFKKMVMEVLSVFLLFSILGVANYLTTKNFWQKDLSQDQINTLTGQSVKIIENFKDPVTINLFVGKGEQDAYLKLIDLYKIHKRNIEINVIDPEVRPDLVKKFEINRYGTVLLSANGKNVVADSPSELDITKAFLKLSRAKNPLILYMTGHEEENLNGQEDDQLGHFSNLLKGQGYDIEEINLLSIDFIPDEADLLMIWGPRRDLTKEEVMKVEDYLMRGKKILLAFNPDFSSFKLNNLKIFLEKYGLIIHNDLVIDIESFVAGSNSMIPLIRTYHLENPITKDFKEQTFFPLSSSISFDFNKKEKYLMEELAITGRNSQSYSKKNLKDILEQKIGFIAGQDEMGPKSLMVSLFEKLNGERRDPIKMVVMGCSTLISNKYRNYGGQFNLVLNAIHWLSDEELMITVDRPHVNQNPVFLNSYQIAFLFYFSLIVGPVSLLALATYFYWRRKKL